MNLAERKQSAAPSIADDWLARFASALAALDAPDLVVAWIHGRLPETRRTLAKHVKPGGRFVQVLGSAHGDPAHPERLAEMALPNAIDGDPSRERVAAIGDPIGELQSPPTGRKFSLRGH